jgi:hypothetical protein
MSECIASSKLFFDFPDASCRKSPLEVVNGAFEMAAKFRAGAQAVRASTILPPQNTMLMTSCRNV